MQIIIFGDSIAYGSFDNEGGWTARLRKYIEEKINAVGNETSYYHELYNLGIPDENSATILERMERETAVRVDDKGALIIFAVGTNDSNWIIAEERTRMTPEEFEANIGALIKKAQGFNARVIFVGPLVVDEVRLQPCPWAPEKTYKNAELRRFDDIIQRVVGGHGVEYIDLATPFVAAGGTALLDDGVHPTTEGHKVIFETVRDVLFKKGLI